MVSIPRGRSKPQQKRLRTENPTPAVAKTVKDVSPDEFGKAYSYHIKRSGKIGSLIPIAVLSFLLLFDVTTRFRSLVVRIDPANLQFSWSFVLFVDSTRAKQVRPSSCFWTQLGCCLARKATHVSVPIWLVIMLWSKEAAYHSISLSAIVFASLSSIYQFHSVTVSMYTVKTGRFKELAPYDPDWWYYRWLLDIGDDIMHHLTCILHFTFVASMARKIILEARNWIGVGGFQKIYGGRKRNGSRPPHFCKSSGAIACRILQQLQRINIIEIDPKGWALHAIIEFILVFFCLVKHPFLLLF